MRQRGPASWILWNHVREDGPAPGTGDARRSGVNSYTGGTTGKAKGMLSHATDGDTIQIKPGHGFQDGREVMMGTIPFSHVRDDRVPESLDLGRACPDLSAV